MRCFALLPLIALIAADPSSAAPAGSAFSAAIKAEDFAAHGKLLADETTWPQCSADREFRAARAAAKPKQTH
ncbi:MAG: hypothetical protein J0I77_07070 [Rudaea sp.]|uniref:hypothetical protein n=1 Tax=unclassified Rudaea TaxID=2627037 RepID=UPI0010F4D5F6|nr:MULTISPECIES: hypothetical protein [unclassified Rudaea]MBN8885463.1 hypothetical protein [Rudaea sp.]